MLIATYQLEAKENIFAAAELCAFEITLKNKHHDLTSQEQGDDLMKKRTRGIYGELCMVENNMH